MTSMPTCLFKSEGWVTITLEVIASAWVGLRTSLCSNILRLKKGRCRASPTVLHGLANKVSFADVHGHTGETYNDTMTQLRMSSAHHGNTQVHKDTARARHPTRHILLVPNGYTSIVYDNVFPSKVVQGCSIVYTTYTYVPNNLIVMWVGPNWAMLALHQTIKLNALPVQY